MRGLRFRLASLLRLRSHELERARAVLAEGERTLARARSELGEIEAEAGRSTGSLEASLLRGLDAVVLRSATAGGHRLASRVREGEGAVRESEQQAARLRHVVRDARTKLRALERLRERSVAAARAATSAAEQRELDEIGARLEHRRAHHNGGRGGR